MTASNTKKIKSFRNTVLTLVWLAVSTPLIILFLYQVRDDYLSRNEAYGSALQRKTERTALIISQSLRQIMIELDQLANDGSVIHSLTMPLLGPVTVEKMSGYLAHNPLATNILLIDNEIMPLEVVPSSALNLNLKPYELAIKSLIASPETLLNPRAGLEVFRNAEGQTQLFFVRPVLTPTDSLTTPFRIDGMLLSQIDVEKLINIIDAEESLSDTKLKQFDIKLFHGNASVYNNYQLTRAPTFSYSAPITLGTLTNLLTLHISTDQTIGLLEIVNNYKRPFLLALLLIGIMLYIVKRLAERLVKPLTNLGEVTDLLGKSNFQRKNIDADNVQDMRYQEFIQLYELLDKMESTIISQFKELHEVNATLEEKVIERTNELIQNVTLLDEQRRSLQQLVRYSIDLQQVNNIEEVGMLTINLVNQITRDQVGIYLARKEYVSGYVNFSRLQEHNIKALQSRLGSFLTIDGVKALEDTQTNLRLLPIGNSNEDYYGFIVVQEADGESNNSETMMVLTTLITSAIRQYNLNKHLDWLAHIDPVTNLANRHYYAEKYAEKVRNFNAKDPSSHFGLYIIDVNGLKHINDYYGHQHGDEMLKAVASAIKETVRTQDTLARVGGDEFCLILDNATANACQVFSERLNELRNRLTMTVNGEPISLTFSFGYACTEVDSLKNLLILADERMYSDKKRYYLSLAEA